MEDTADDSGVGKVEGMAWSLLSWGQESLSPACGTGICAGCWVELAVHYRWGESTPPLAIENQVAQLSLKKRVKKEPVGEQEDGVSLSVERGCIK